MKSIYSVILLSIFLSSFNALAYHISYAGKSEVTSIKCHEHTWYSISTVNRVHNSRSNHIAFDAEVYDESWDSIHPSELCSWINDGIAKKQTFSFYSTQYGFGTFVLSIYNVDTGEYFPVLQREYCNGKESCYRLLRDLDHINTVAYQRHPFY